MLEILRADDGKPITVCCKRDGYASGPLITVAVMADLIRSMQFCERHSLSEISGLETKNGWVLRVQNTFTFQANQLHDDSRESALKKYGKNALPAILDRCHVVSGTFFVPQFSGCEVWLSDYPRVTERFQTLHHGDENAGKALRMVLFGETD